MHDQLMLPSGRTTGILAVSGKKRERNEKGYQNDGLFVFLW